MTKSEMTAKIQTLIAEREELNAQCLEAMNSLVQLRVASMQNLRNLTDLLRTVDNHLDEPDPADYWNER